MQLREHPLMHYRGIPNWPPVWVKIPSSVTLDKRHGEIGVLVQAVLSRIEPSIQCYLLIEDEGESYMGSLLFDDAALCRQVCELLQNHVGKTVKQIGDLDLSFTL